MDALQFYHLFLKICSFTYQVTVTEFDHEILIIYPHYERVKQTLGTNAQEKNEINVQIHRDIVGSIPF